MSFENLLAIQYLIISAYQKLIVLDMFTLSKLERHMEHLSQADLARCAGFSPMTVGRVLNRWGRVRGELTDLDRIVVLAVHELSKQNMSTAEAAALFAELDSEVRYVAQDATNQCWVTFAKRGGRKFHLASLSTRHLAAVIAAFPFSRVLALHDTLASAQKRLEGLKAERAAA